MRFFKVNFFAFTHDFKISKIKLLFIFKLASRLHPLISFKLINHEYICRFKDGVRTILNKCVELYRFLRGFSDLFQTAR